MKSFVQKSKKEHYKLWSNFILKYWPIYLSGVFAVLVTDFCQVYYTRAMGWVLDFFTKKSFPIEGEWSDKEKFIYLFAFMVLMRVLLTLGRVGWRMTLARQSHYAAGFLKEKVWENARYFPRHELKNIYSKGLLMNAANSDVGASRFLFGFTLVGAVDVFFLGIITFIAMVDISWKFTVVTVLSLSLLPWVIKKISSSEVERYKEAQEALDQFNDQVAQSVGSIRLQKMSDLGRFWTAFLEAGADKYRLKWLSAIKVSISYMPAIGLSNVVVYLVLFIYGLDLYLKGELSVGDFVAINGLAFIIQDPLIELGYIISEWRKGMASLERLNQIFSAKKESFLYRPGQIISGHENIFKLDNVSFRFQDGDENVLNNFSIEVKKGERFGITGPIGSGKTVLLDILSGLERGHEGDVHFKGKSFDEYSHSDLRKEIAYVHQRPFLFADTIRANVSLDLTMSDEEIWKILWIACLDEDVKRFEKGLETPLGEWGVNLSGGQKQRLSLARALARKPDVLLLDDCLSAVDTVTEEKILSRIDEYLAQTTVIWVAHRKSTLKYCNHILELGINE